MPFNVEVVPRLQAAIDAMPASDHLTFLVTAQDKPFTAAGFGNYFRDTTRQDCRSGARHMVSERPQRPIWPSSALPTIN